MKKTGILFFAVATAFLISCGNHSETKSSPTDSAGTGAAQAIDSAANNGILPPSAAPGNANNSSIADTTYKVKDSSKKK